MIAAGAAWDAGCCSRVTEQPGDELRGNAPTTFPGGRPSVVVHGIVEQVTSDVMADALPCVGEWEDDKGVPHRRFELPGSGAADENQAVREQLGVHSSPHDPLRSEVTITIEDQLPRCQGEDRTPDSDPSDKAGELRPVELQAGHAGKPLLRPDGSSPYQTASMLVERLIDQHVDWVNRLFDNAPKVAPTSAWQGVLGGIAMRRVNDTVSVWQQVDEADQPRMALVVKLARELPAILNRVCRHPRRVLRRERQMQSLGRVREVDPGCLLWLARQPGRSVAERAGPRQQVLAIARVEDVDTLENRVVRDLLSRADSACARYLREHRGVAHDRVTLVKKFRRQLRSLMKSSPINDAALLVGMPQPNYVLQMDASYSKLWAAWQQLVRQQQLEDNVWRWRQRLFAEHVQISFIAAVSLLADDRHTHGGDVILQREQNAGQFIDRRTALGPWVLKNDSLTRCVDLVRGDQIRKHPLIPAGLAGLSPDFVLVNRCRSASWDSPRSEFATRLLAVWTMLDFDLGSDQLEDRLLSLSDRVGATKYGGPIRCLLVQPQGDWQQRETLIELDTCRALRMTLPLQSQLTVIQSQLQWAWDAMP